MKKLTVFYDASCGFCRRCREWLERQPQVVALEMVPAGSADARARFPQLRQGELDELVAVSDDGRVYRGERAYILCLYALREYRGWAYRLAQPRLRPLVRLAFGWLSQSRKDISRLLAVALRDGAPAEELRGCRVENGCGR